MTSQENLKEKIFYHKSQCSDSYYIFYYDLCLLLVFTITQFIRHKKVTLDFHNYYIRS